MSTDSDQSSPSSSPETPPPYTYPPITIILTTILLVFVVVGFFVICFCRCVVQNLLITLHIRNSPTGTPLGPPGSNNQNAGLDPLIIQSFPTITYSSVKGYRRENCGLECAICLVEFEDDDVLRLMTACCHVFHQECIDLWLDSHKTCPVCRRNLEEPVMNNDRSPFCGSNRSNNNVLMHDIINEDELLEDTYSISIRDENDLQGEEGKGGGGASSSSTTSCTCENQCCSNSDEQQSIGGQRCKAHMFSRSHSTGHSIVKTTPANSVGEEEDRYTLRLPEHVKSKIIRGHNSTRSCTTFGEYRNESTSVNGGFGELADLPKRSTSVA